MTHRQIVALDEAGVDMFADGRAFELGLDGLFGPEDNARRDLNDAPSSPSLDDLSIEQILGRFKNRLAWPPTLPAALELFAQAVCFEQRIVIALEFVGREQRQTAVRTVAQAFDKAVGIRLNVASDNKVDDDFVARIECYPDPLVTIDGLEFFQGRQMRFLFLTKDQSLSNWRSSR